MNSKDEVDSLIDRFSESLGIDSSAGKPLNICCGVSSLGMQNWVDFSGNFYLKCINAEPTKM